ARAAACAVHETIGTVRTELAIDDEKSAHTHADRPAALRPEWKCAQGAEAAAAAQIHRLRGRPVSRTTKRRSGRTAFAAIAGTAAGEGKRRLPGPGSTIYSEPLAVHRQGATRLNVHVP